LQYKKFWSEEEQRWIELRVTPKGMKTINKIGLAAAMKQAKANGLMA
jgi:large subunit ribosomal protein L28